MDTEKNITAKQIEHVHDYFGRTSVNQDHFHTFVGTTSTESVVVDGHVHSFANETREARGHTHLMNGTTGRNVAVLMGHVHQMAGATTVNAGHSHTFDLFTGYQRPPRNQRKPRITGVVGEKQATRERRRLRPRSPFRNPTEKQQ